MVLLAVAVIVTLVGVRLALVFPRPGWPGSRGAGRTPDAPAGWRETLVVGWAGMRGVVTVATALALPLTTASGAPFPHRDTIIAVGLATVLLTSSSRG